MELNMIHLVICMTHLEECKPDALNRQYSNPPIVINDDQAHYEVENNKDQRTTANGIEMLVRWRGNNVERWIPREQMFDDTPQLVRKFNRAKRQAP